MYNYVCFTFFLFLQEIGPESPANNRLRTIRELSEVVLNKRLEEVRNSVQSPRLNLVEKV